MTVDARILSALKTAIYVLIFSAALFLSGCFRRQTVPRLVYVPAPPPAANANPAQSGNVLIIQPPAPPAAAESAPKHEESETAAQTPKLPRRRKVIPSGTPEADTEANAPEPASSDAPALLPELSLQQQIDLEKQIGDLRGAVRQRIARLGRMNLSAEDRKALQDARLFLSEADEAMQSNNLQQSLNLAQKADVLISAVEKRH